MASQNDLKLREFGRKLANLGQALADGVGVDDLDELIAAISGVAPVGEMLKGPDAAKAWVQVVTGIMTDVADDNMSVPD